MFYEEYNDGDERAEFDQETLDLLEEERKLKVISNFKDFISKEPEFYGINNISSFEILNIINTTTSNINNYDYPEWQIKFIDDMINEVLCMNFDENFIKNVYSNIYNKIYIN